MLHCNLQMIELRLTLESGSGCEYALLQLAVVLQQARYADAALKTRFDEYIRFVRAQ